MKRAIALLLALVCLFSLGTVSAFAETEINLNDMEDEALLEVYRNAYSILVERGVIEKRRTIGIEGGGAFSFPVDFTDEEMEGLAFLLSIMLKENGNGKNEEAAEEVPSGLPDEPTKDLISVEEFSIDEFSNRKTIKIRNVSGTTVPCFICNYVLMDKNGDILDTGGHIVTDRLMIDDGDAFTETDYTLLVDGDYSKVAMVKFTSYTLRDVLDGEFHWVKEYAFIDPPVFVRNPDGSFSKHSASDEASISEALSAIEWPEEAEAVVCALNDTIETDTVRLTVTDFFYEDELYGNSIISQPGTVNFMSISGSIYPEDREIWACIELTLENVSKSQFAVEDVLSVIVDYNDGYKFSSEETTGIIISADDRDAVSFRTINDGTLLRNPLTSEEYLVAISCSPRLREDTESPIKVIFELPDGIGTRTFIYEVQ